MDFRRIVFSGDRNAMYSKYQKSIEHIFDQFSITAQDMIIHGGCKGIDSIVNIIAQRRGCQIQMLKAEWDKHGHAAGPIRNIDMLNLKPDIVICIHPDLTQSKGTAHMYREAKKRNIQTYLYS